MPESQPRRRDLWKVPTKLPNPNWAETARIRVLLSKPLERNKGAGKAVGNEVLRAGDGAPMIAWASREQIRREVSYNRAKVVVAGSAYLCGGCSRSLRGAVSVARRKNIDGETRLRYQNFPQIHHSIPRRMQVLV